MKRRIIGLIILMSLVMAGRVEAKIVDGTFYTFSDEWSNPTVENVGQFMDEIHELQMDTLIISELVRKTPNSGCSSSSFTWANNYQALLQEVFRKAEQHNIDVYVGLVSSSGGCTDWNFFAEPNKSKVVNLLKDNSNPNNPLAFVANNYGNNPRFKGWYLTEEPGLTVWGDTDELLDYWAQLTSAVKARSNKPVLAAPSLCGVDGILGNPAITPEEVGRRALKFKQRTGVDIQLWQDCVNQTGVAITKDNVGNRHTTGEYYYAIAQAIGSQNVWADIEIGNCCMYPSMKGGAYYPAAIAKVNSQIYQGRSTGPAKVVTWFNQGQMTKVARGRMAGSDRLLAMYKALFGYTNEYSMLKPAAYTWVAAPSSTYPDTDNKELFDEKAGEYKNFGGINPTSDPRYVGMIGNAEVNLDFGKVVNPMYVGAHVLNFSGGAILFPISISVSCSLDNSDWQQIGTYQLGVERLDSELVIANDGSPISGKSCRYVKVKLNNDPGSWTFVSEMEIVGGTAVTPTNIPTSVPTVTLSSGDANRDGKVDLLDFSIWKSEYSGRVATKKADFNKDNKVDLLDFSLWKREYLRK